MADKYGVEANRCSVGDTVHVNSDHEDWGRIAEDGIIHGIEADGLLVEIGGNIRATVFVRFDEVSPRSQADMRTRAKAAELQLADLKRALEDKEAWEQPMPWVRAQMLANGIELPQDLEEKDE